MGHEQYRGKMNQDDKNPIEEVVKRIHIVIPIVGAVLAFMLAFIAITMA